MLEQLKEQIGIVVEARLRAQESSDFKNAVMAKWAEKNSVLFEEAISTATRAREAEDRLRQLTLQAYAETGDKAPVPGVGIREVTKLSYDTKVAFTWAIDHKMALKLDTSAFEKIAKVSPPGFVEVSQVPQATIATQLEVK